MGEDSRKVVRIASRFRFGDLENDVVKREIGTGSRFQRELDASGRLVHGIGKKIDPEQGLHVKRGGKSNRFDSPGLIEGISVLIGYLIENVDGAAAVEWSHQCLIGINLYCDDIHKGLKRHRKSGAAALPAALADLFEGRITRWHWQSTSDGDWPPWRRFTLTDYSYNSLRRAQRA